MASIALLVVVPFLMAYAAASDLLTMTIPNRLTLALAGLFLVVALACGLGWSTLAAHGGAGAVTLVATFTMFSLGWMGGGDAKLASATALWLGFDGLPDYLLLSSLAGGGLTLAILVARQHYLPLFAARWPWAVRLHDAKTGIPYGIALSAAALMTLPSASIWATLLAA